MTQKTFIHLSIVLETTTTNPTAINGIIDQLTGHTIGQRVKIVAVPDVFKLVVKEQDATIVDAKRDLGLDMMRFMNYVDPVEHDAHPLIIAAREAGEVAAAMAKNAQHSVPTTRLMPPPKREDG